MIADFGLSVFLPPNHDDVALHLNEILGTAFYKDPEYKKTGKLKRESDVYSFGVVLFEVLFGRRANDQIYLDNGLAHVARQCYREGKINEMIDVRIKEETGENNFIQNKGPNKDSLETFSNIAYQCLAETQDQRPTMKVIIRELEKALAYQMGGHNVDAMEWTQDCDEYFLEILANRVKRNSHDTLILGANDWIEMDEQICMKFALRNDPERLKGKYNHLKFVHCKFVELINNNSVTCDPLTGKVPANEMLWNELFNRDMIFKTFKEKGCKIYPLLTVVFGGSTASDMFHNAATYDQEHKLAEDDLSTYDVCDVGEGEFPMSSKRFKKEVILDTSSQSKIARKETDFAKAEQYKSNSCEVTSSLVEEFSIACCMSTLEATPDVSTRSYTKAMTYFPDLDWRKMFLIMPVHRRKEWLDTLDD